MRREVNSGPLSERTCSGRPRSAIAASSTRVTRPEPRLKSASSAMHSRGVVGGQPTIEYNLTHRIVSSVGVLFTAAGNHDIAGAFPNFSLYYYFGKVTPR